MVDQFEGYGMHLVNGAKGCEGSQAPLLLQYAFNVPPQIFARFDCRVAS